MKINKGHILPFLFFVLTVSAMLIVSNYLETKADEKRKFIKYELKIEKPIKGENIQFLKCYKMRIQGS